MANGDTGDPRTRILFMSAVLGVMFGVCVYLAVKVVQNQNFVLLAVLPAVFLTAIPMVREIVRLRRGVKAGEK